MADPTSPKKKTARGRKNRTIKSSEEILKDNQDILDYVRRHPQDRVADIARGVNLERDTTQKRLNKLTDLGALQRRYEVDLDALDFKNRYRIDVHLNPRDLEERKNDLGNDTPNLQQRLAFRLLALNEENSNIIIEDIAVLMGDPADLCVTLRTRGLDQQAIFKFVTEEVRILPGIDRTSTCIEAWSLSRENAAKEARRAKEAAELKKQAGNKTKPGRPNSQRPPKEPTTAV